MTNLSPIFIQKLGGRYYMYALSEEVTERDSWLFDIVATGGGVSIHVEDGLYYFNAILAGEDEVISSLTPIDSEMSEHMQRILNTRNPHLFPDVG